jgi:hypothetical protein
MDGSLFGSLVASDVRLDAGGDKYPSSPIDDADTLINGLAVDLPDDMLYEVPKRELLAELLDERLEAVEATE